MNNKTLYVIGAIAALVLLVVGIYLLHSRIHGVIGPSQTTVDLALPWLVITASMFLLWIALGAWLFRNAINVLVDWRNRVTLTGLQLHLWWFTVLGAYATALLANEFVGVDPTVKIPDAVMGLLGLALATPLLSVLIVQSKRQSTPRPEDENRSLRAFNAFGLKWETPDGLIARHPSPADASVLDLVLGEEVGNAGAVDWARAQSLATAIILLVVYSWLLGRLFGKVSLTCGVSTLPDVDGYFLAWLAASQGALVVNKLLPHTRTI
jgi:hypothetical protein